jgi:hypothetical protein
MIHQPGDAEAKQMSARNRVCVHGAGALRSDTRYKRKKQYLCYWGRPREPGVMKRVLARLNGEAASFCGPEACDARYGPTLWARGEKPNVKGT